MEWKLAKPKLSIIVGASISVNNTRIYLNAAMVNLLREKINDGKEFDALRIEYIWNEKVGRADKIRIKPAQSDVDEDVWSCPAKGRDSKGRARNYRSVNSKELCRDILGIAWKEPKKFEPIEITKDGAVFDLTEKYEEEKEKK